VAACRMRDESEVMRRIYRLPVNSDYIFHRGKLKHDANKNVLIKELKDE
jgi:hypothetical protein